ncbi:histone acetyltransferase KAT7-like protein [Dinothrombium tinctorium]|uniref:Histone acetyltransferase n=1 Tax=Dinothrombium tinctorium TaxID=1965070 RepID=A0A3S3SAP5_9ACAR|nr:histone acetyltransferase KAT7-like protein [Dinothrombium tinctorium]RWS11550.1 histone acetyltransferase KAT7-like protein [Dinothrombium tinctorium]
MSFRRNLRSNRSNCAQNENSENTGGGERCERRLRRRDANGQAIVKIAARKTALKDERHRQLMEQRRKEVCTMLNSPPKRKENNANSKANSNSSSKEPNLRNLTPIFDYEMFKQAQAKAAKLLQEQMKDANNKKDGIKHIEMGKYEMEVWYSSPYPEEYLCLPKLYICEFCLKYFNLRLVLKRHMMKCPYHCPPGDEIYRKGNISIFEIDGEKNKFYCRNLCLVAKLFLDHKTLYYDVEPFKFYIMTEFDSEGFHIIGYFSKEKNSFLNYNVSCILTFPPYQKQGYGRMLIDFSYLLTKLEGKVGSPEKPLSDLGLISYRSYWKNVILEYLCNYKDSEISIKDLSQETAINAYDIVSTLQALGMLKYWKGKHLVLTRKEILDEYRAKLKKKKNIKTIDQSCLHWQPSTSSSNSNR